jgi:hypothetical protein
MNDPEDATACVLTLSTRLVAARCVELWSEVKNAVVNCPLKHLSVSFPRDAPGGISEFDVSR